MPKGGSRDGAGRKRSKHGLIAEAGGILQTLGLKCFAIAMRDGRLPARKLYELQREILREAMGARRRIDRALERDIKKERAVLLRRVRASAPRADRTVSSFRAERGRRGATLLRGRPRRRAASSHTSGGDRAG